MIRKLGSVKPYFLPLRGLDLIKVEIDPFGASMLGEFLCYILLQPPNKNGGHRVFI